MDKLLSLVILILVAWVGFLAINNKHKADACKEMYRGQPALYMQCMGAE